MPCRIRGQRLAGLATLLTLALLGSGCQTTAPTCAQCAAPGKPGGGGLITQVSALTSTWKMPAWGQRSSPSAPLNALVRPTTPTQMPAQLPAPVIQPAAGKNSTTEPELASQIPVTTMTGPPPAYGGTLPQPLTTPQPVRTLPLPVAAPPQPHPAPIVVAKPVSYAPGPNPVVNFVQGIKAKMEYHHTADPIKFSPPVPHGVPREFEKRSLPPYIIEPPDILLVESTAALKDTQPIRGQHLVRPDGRISLGVYGEVYVAGLTIAEAKEAVVRVLSARLKEVSDRNTNVDVIAYNSKKYYIITDGGGFGEQVYPFPITGNETVLDALSNIYGLPAVASLKNIWIARATPDGSPYPKILPVDWKGISQYGSASTNWQILPGDRIYVKAQGIIHTDTKLARWLSPFERVFGTTLLGGGAISAARNAFR